MRWDILVFLSLVIACGRVDVTPPANPSEAPATATSTGTGTGTATAATPAPAAAPAVVVNNTINNTQNGATPAAGAPAASNPAHPGLIAKGDSQAEVQAVLGPPTSVAGCGVNLTGWWYSATYCIGFANGAADSQYQVPANKLYLPSW